ncbi:MULTISPECIES: DUF4124 domain-containing protein [unclassified Luteibacter]|uniref:DUF4124 domain-containing protein n=1 Tax=unclassified Luteibacter TaxID=2620188 RepID=UPI0008C40DC7|nr:MULTISPECIES: DUF4124 domain-containing protein [unclassified Luteibacter]SEO65186.1 protein of unknown function [Luteibacter sp. UNC138MFCol5.1]SEV84634.1 protein of unknown function [Luteibacter sp. 329MFSha]
MRRCLALAILVTVCPLAFAQAYKWKDAQGVTHYADAPPPGSVRYEKIKTTGTVEAPAPPPATAKSGSADDGKTSANPASAEDTPANRKKLCDQLRKNTDILTNERVVTMDDGKGGQAPLDDAARKRQIETTQAQMTLYCKS